MGSLGFGYDGGVRKRGIFLCRSNLLTASRSMRWGPWLQILPSLLPLRLQHLADTPLSQIPVAAPG